MPADNFLPAPKVDSAVVRIVLYRDNPCKPLDEPTLFRTIHAAFEQRRKTLPNALSAGFGELSKEEISEVVASCGHPLNIRGEKLSIQEFTALSDALFLRIRQK